MKKQILFTLTLVIILSFLGCETTKITETFAYKISGSDTEFELVKNLATNYNLIDYTIEQGGSSKGIDDLMKGNIQIANSSRDIFDYEYDMAKSKDINLTSIIIATDAIAFVTHPNNPIDSLSTIQLSKVLSGKINNWNQVGGPDRKIVLHGRNNFSGTRAFLKSRFIPNENFPVETVSHLNNQEIINAVKTDTFGIGYVGAGFIMDKTGKPNPDIWALYLYVEGDNQAYSPYQYQAVIQGKYPLTRPLYQIFNGVPSGDIQDFLNFELSIRGQEIVRENGFFPINSDHELLNSTQLNTNKNSSLVSLFIMNSLVNIVM